MKSAIPGINIINPSSGLSLSTILEIHQLILQKNWEAIAMTMQNRNDTPKCLLDLYPMGLGNGVDQTKVTNMVLMTTYQELARNPNFYISDKYKNNSVVFSFGDFVVIFTPFEMKNV